MFARYDLLVTPTVAALPSKNQAGGNTRGPEEVKGEAVDQGIGWCLTYPFNFTGHPAASIPAGLADGLPVGMQIVGRHYGDADVLAASATFEQLRPWFGTYRICADRPVWAPEPGRDEELRQSSTGSRVAINAGATIRIPEASPTRS